MLGPIDRFAFEQQQSTLKVHSITFGGDAVCTACNRVLRLAGFPNCGHDPACHVTLEYLHDSASIDSNFRLDIPTANAILWPHAIPSRESPDKHTDSEHDWAWVYTNLLTEKTPRSWRRDPPITCTHLLRQRTVDVASPTRWLIEGVPMATLSCRLELAREEACIWEESMASVRVVKA
jgi:hypothetical protein